MSKNQKPNSHAAPPVKQGCDVKVTIGRVIRGNPYVDRNAKPTRGLPDSLPPNRTYEVEIRVEPALEKACPGEFIEVSIAGCSDDNGTATVTPAKITKTATVTVAGVKQTVPRHGGNLKVQARLGNRVLALSPGFTVCAHPLNFKDVFDSNIEDTLQEKHVIGMQSTSSWESDSGTAAVGGIVADLNKVQIQELLLEPRPPEPPFHNYPFDHSGYELGNAFTTDRHAILYPEAGPKGDWTLSQLSIFKCDRCGCRDIVMPNSGMHITFRVVNGNGWKFLVEKTGAQVLVNGFSSAAATAQIKTDPVPLVKE